MHFMFASPPGHFLAPADNVVYVSCGFAKVLHCVMNGVVGIEAQG